MFRIYRDVHFSEGQAAYKEHAACHFRHALAKDVHAPGFYMHFGRRRGGVAGGGMWMRKPDGAGQDPRPHREETARMESP